VYAFPRKYSSYSLTRRTRYTRSALRPVCFYIGTIVYYNIYTMVILFVPACTRDNLERRKDSHGVEPRVVEEQSVAQVCTPCDVADVDRCVDGTGVGGCGSQRRRGAGVCRSRWWPYFFGFSRPSVRYVRIRSRFRGFIFSSYFYYHYFGPQTVGSRSLRVITKPAFTSTRHGDDNNKYHPVQ